MRIAIQILCLMAAVWIVACATNSGTTTPERTRRTPPTVQLSIAPGSANVRARGAQQFSITVSGTSNSTVIWSVNGVAGGNLAVGTINSDGLYVAPQTLPTPNNVTVAAVSTVSTAAKASAAVALLNPTPILSNVSPSLVNSGSFTLTITGSNFVSGAQVTLSGVPLSTSFVNATELLVSGSQSTPGTYAVTVTNPNPGASTSSAINLAVNANARATPVQLSITPGSASVRAHGAEQFSVSVKGTSNSTVTWSVNGIPGGNSALGTINSGGLYVAPQILPTPNNVTITAVSTVNTTAKASAAIALLNPTPILNNVSPPLVNAGSFTLTITGSNFVSGAQVTLPGVPLNTSFINATQLLASGSQTTPGTYAVTVTNPSPGPSTSYPINLVVNANAQATACSGMIIGPGASLNGVIPFPGNNPWNENISTAPVDPNSNALIGFIGGTIGIHPDFGSGQYNGSSIGIPYTIVGAPQAPVNVTFNAYGDESDPGPMPIPANAAIEGFPNPGDQHVLVLDRNNCWLYELYGASVNSNGNWNAASAAVWDLENYNQRPLTWTSADAAGLPIFPGLARYDEVASGAIKHALRFTLQHSRAAFVLPATHWAANSTNANAAPMGMRLRLKSSFNTSTFSPANQVLLEALKQYGMIMADNGSSMFLSGAPDARWDNSDLHALGQVKASDFEVVKMDTIYTSANIPQGQAPGVHSFSASPSGPVRAGTPVTLSWSTTNASYFVVSPEVGAVRGSSVNVTPKVTTTYTLYATNEFGRSTATVTVIVQ